MEPWVHRALEKWPNVPHLYGWLGLDRRGRWLIKGEIISRPQIIDTINRNYGADERGCWYFQNGPQRGYVALESAPLVLQATEDRLWTHTQMPVTRMDAAFLDETGGLLLATEHGPGSLEGPDLGWALARLSGGESELADALALPCGGVTTLQLCGRTLQRLDQAQAPARLGFVREPQPGQATIDGIKGGQPR